MANHLTLRFGVEIAIAAVAALILIFATRYFNSQAKVKTIAVDYFRAPTNNALVVLGLLLPVLTALAGYFYLTNPNGQYSLLLATIVVFFAVLIVGIWESFALLGKAQGGDKIQITLPADRRYIVGMGLMYGFLLLGMIYFAGFFLFELTPMKQPLGPDCTTSVGSRSLLKPAAHISQSKDDVLKSWGEPTAQDLAKRTLSYQSEQSEVQLTFDGEGKVVEILEKGR